MKFHVYIPHSPLQHLDLLSQSFSLFCDRFFDCFCEARGEEEGASLLLESDGFEVGMVLGVSLG
jgi:hypothetical protein